MNFIRVIIEIQKPKNFYDDGIKKLVGRWEEVIDKNGDYTDD